MNGEGDEIGEDGPPTPGGETHVQYGEGEQQQHQHDEYYYHQHVPHHIAYGYHMIDPQWAAHNHDMQQQDFAYQYQQHYG
jgi:hypothetical protein